MASLNKFFAKFHVTVPEAFVSILIFIFGIISFYHAWQILSKGDERSRVKLAFSMGTEWVLVAVYLFLYFSTGI